MSQAQEIAAFGLELVQAWRRTSASRALIREEKPAKSARSESSRLLIPTWVRLCP